MFSNKYVRVLVIALFAAMLLGALPVAAQDAVVVQWFVGLGAGGQPPQIDAQNAVVEEFNSTHDDVQIEIIIVDNNVARDTLSTLIAAGDAPDIVGPVGIEGSNAFDGQWADLTPLVEAAGYDLTQFSEAAVDFYRIEGQGLVGLPFGVFPSAIFYNRDLFDVAGIPYPPHEFGATYTTWDGQEVEWDVAALRDVAMLMTLDANGNDATSPDFDPENVVQWGLEFQWANEIRPIVVLFGAGNFVDTDFATAIIPENWVTVCNGGTMASGSITSSPTAARLAAMRWQPAIRSRRAMLRWQTRTCGTPAAWVRSPTGTRLLFHHTTAISPPNCTLTHSASWPRPIPQPSPLKC
jgi:hypothetical protein